MELVLQPLPRIQEVDLVPLLVRTEGRRAVARKRLTLDDLALGREQVADSAPPRAGRVPKLVVDHELHDVLRDVLRQTITARLVAECRVIRHLRGLKVAQTLVAVTQSLR